MKRFTGFSIEQTKSIPLRKFIGFSLESVNNFVIRVVDNLGNLVPGSTVEVTYSGTTSTYETESGVVSLFIQNPVNSIRVEAYKDCLLGEPVFTSHGGEGFNVSVDIEIGELPCLNSNDENQYNFIRWKTSNNLSFPLTSELRTCTNCNDSGASEQVTNRIPNAYAEEYDRNLCKKYFPVIVKNEEYTFIINKKYNQTLFANKNLTICLIDSNNNQINIATQSVSLSTVDPNGERLVFASYTLTNEVLKDGRLYRIALYDSLTNAILFISNELEYYSSDYGYKTVYLQYRNSSNVYGFDYNDIPDYNKLRVNLTRIDAQPEIELTQYQEASTGKVRNQKTQAKKILTLESYFFDDYAHDAMLALSLHDDILINSKVMEVKTAYQIETNVRSNTNKGTIEMYDQGYSTVNLAGN